MSTALTGFVKQRLPHSCGALSLGVREDERQDLVRVRVEERFDGLEVVYHRAAVEERAAGMAEVQHAVIDVRLRLQHADTEAELRRDVHLLVARD